jgi:DHA1 family bicyclomycin/chloramphenicol resistance-like MFS transporter
VTSGERPTPLRVVVVLGMLTAFAPLSNTMHIPALPEMSDDLGATASVVQLTVSALTIGLALGQMVSGPLSDRLGRRGPLLGGMAIYVATSIACALAPSAALLIAFRVLQGVAGAAAIVIGRAMVRDLHSGDEAARLFSLLVLVTGVTPVLAPLLGGQLLLLGSWREIFVAQGAVAAIVALAAWRILPETLAPERRRPEAPLAVTRRAMALLRERAMLGCALTLGLIYGAMLAGLAGSGFVFQEVYGASEQLAAGLLAVGAAGMIAASRGGALVVRRVGPRRLVTIGIAASTVGGLAGLVAVAADAGIVPLVLGLFLVYSGFGLTLPNATAVALADHPHVAGSASAALGIVQYGIGAAAAPIAGLAGQDTAVPMVVTVLVLALGAALTWRLLPAPALAVPVPGPAPTAPAGQAGG